MYNARSRVHTYRNRCRAVVLRGHAHITITVSEHRVKRVSVRVTVVRRQLPVLVRSAVIHRLQSETLRAKCTVIFSAVTNRVQRLWKRPKQILSVLGFSIGMLSLCTNVISRETRSTVLFYAIFAQDDDLHGVGRNEETNSSRAHV